MKHLAPFEQPHTQKMQLLAASDWANELNAIQIEKLANYLKSYSTPTEVTILKEGERNDFFLSIM